MLDPFLQAILLEGDGEIRGLALSLLSLLLIAPSSGAEWTDHARKLIGEPPGVTRVSIAELRKDRDLPEKLKKALGSKDHFLALDVMASLGMKSMIPTLLSFASRDRTGFSYHALNTLIGSKDYPRISKLYQERLRKPKTSLAAKMAMLDTLGRIGAEIDVQSLSDLLTADESPEVRSAALYYLRNAVLRRRRQELYPLLKSALKDPAFQNRLQALYLISEIPPSERESRPDFFASIYPLCSNDPQAQVKALCSELAKEKAGTRK